MKSKFSLSIALIFFSTYLFSQIKTVKPLTQKTVVTTPVTTTTMPQPVKTEKPLTQKTVVTTPVTTTTMPQPVKTENTPPTAALTGAQVYIQTGENEKSSNTIFTIEIYDSKLLKAADYSEVGLTMPVEDDRYKGHIKYVPYVPEFIPGDKESLSARLDASEVVGVEIIGIQPHNVTRYAIFSDFVNGGSVSIFIFPKTMLPLIGPDTWKINSLTVQLSFGNSPASQHSITWNGITLSGSNLSRTLKFDKNFNPIQ